MDKIYIVIMSSYPCNNILITAFANIGSCLVIQVGDKLGWGIRYLPPITVDDVSKHPIICCVSMNNRYQTSVCYLEPDGGYFPFVAFTAQGKLVR